MNSKREEQIEASRKLVRRAIAGRRQVIVYEIARRCEALMTELSFGTASPIHAGENVWVRIESLSGLRALVGGRFQNLKDKWVKAGFPLREHRGDRAGLKTVDYQGWVELAAWINKQGFEVKLAEEAQPWLFELKSTAVNSGE